MKYSITNRPTLLKPEDVVNIDGVDFISHSTFLRHPTKNVPSVVRGLLKEWLGRKNYERLSSRYRYGSAWPEADSSDELTEDVNMIYDALSKPRRYDKNKRPSLLKYHDTVKIGNYVFRVMSGPWMYSRVAQMKAPELLKEWLGGAAFRRLQKNRKPNSTYWPQAGTYEQLTKDVNMVLDAVL